MLAKSNNFSFFFFFNLGGLYWGLNALDILGESDKLPRNEVIEFVLSCQDPITGGFGANVEYDPHILYTLSAVQILLIEDALDKIDRNKVAKCKYRYILSHKFIILSFFFFLIY